MADNLARHGQPYFNLNERVMAGSSPLWLLLLTPLAMLFGEHLPSAVAILNALLLGATALAWGILTAKVATKNSSIMAKFAA